MSDYYSFICEQREEKERRDTLKKERAEKRKSSEREKLISALAEKYDEFKTRNVSYDADLAFLKHCILKAYENCN